MRIGKCNRRPPLDRRATAKSDKVFSASFLGLWSVMWSVLCSVLCSVMRSVMWSVMWSMICLVMCSVASPLCEHHLYPGRTRDQGQPDLLGQACDRVYPILYQMLICFLGFFLFLIRNRLCLKPGPDILDPVFDRQRLFPAV